MSVLVIGRGQAAALVADAVAARGEIPTPRASVAAALETLADAGSTFGLILVEVGSHDDSARLPQLMAASSAAPVVTIAEAPAQPCDGGATAPAMCGLDHTADGRQRLRCALLEAEQGNEARSRGAPADPTAVGFAYNAPCSRRR